MPIVAESDTLARVDEELDRVIAEVSEQIKNWPYSGKSNEDHELSPAQPSSQPSERTPEPPTPATEIPAESLSPVERRLESIAAALDSQYRAIDTKLDGVRGDLEKVGADGLQREQLFSELHEMVKDYRDLYILETIEKPLLLDLVLLYDTVSRMLENVKSDPEAGERSAERITAILDELLEVLFRRDTKKMVLEGDQIDRKMQKIVRVEIQEGTQKGLRVASVVRDGFVWRGKVLRPQEVVVIRYRDGVLEEPEDDSEPK